MPALEVPTPAPHDRRDRDRRVRGWGAVRGGALRGAVLIAAAAALVTSDLVAPPPAEATNWSDRIASVRSSQLYYEGAMRAADLQLRSLKHAERRAQRRLIKAKRRLAQAREQREDVSSRQRTMTLQLQWARARLARQIAPPISPDDLASLATLPASLSRVGGGTGRDGAGPMRELEGAQSVRVAEPATLELASGLVLPILESRVAEPATLELASGLVLPILDPELGAREATPPADAAMPGTGVLGVSVAAQLERAAETLRHLEEEADLQGRAVDRTRRKVHRVTRSAQARARSVRTIRAGIGAATARRGGAEAGLANAILAMSDLAPRRVAKKTDVRLGQGSDFAWPTTGRLVQGYGCTGFYLNPARGSCPHFHDGIDIAGYLGTPIRAAAVGVVSYIGWNPWDHKQRAFMVVVAHPNGLETLYGHVLPRRDVRVGQLVRRGEVIGYMGSTGMATGVHLHLEMRRGRTTLDPLAFL